MADVFISYKRENQDAVQRIVQGLRGVGLSVWWDQDIAPDAAWEETIERELEASKVTIVAWSEAAIGSENVKAEARRARNQGKLIQTYVQACTPPLFFGERQGVDLVNWNGNPNDNRFVAIIEATRAIIAGKKPPAGVGYRPRKRAPWALLVALFAFLSAVFTFVSNAGGARDAVCKTGDAVHEFCLQYNLITADAPTVEEQQALLIQSVAGMWGRLDRSCADTVTYAVTQDESGIYRIHGTATDFDSTMQVMTIDPATKVITARATQPNEQGMRELWEYRPNGDVLALRDQAGTETTLARCGE